MSLLDYVKEEFAYVVALPILGLIVNLLIRGYRVRKIRKRYGDGSQGYVFDVTDEAIEEVFDQVGVKIAFEKPQRMEETKGVWR